MATTSRSKTSASSKIEDCPVLNVTGPNPTNISLIITLGSSGHPLLATVPASFGHSSSLSKTESPSESGHGHPLFPLGPTVPGQLSSPSVMPSPSESGQPDNVNNPATFGH